MLSIRIVGASVLRCPLDANAFILGVNLNVWPVRGAVFYDLPDPVASVDIRRTTTCRLRMGLRGFDGENIWQKDYQLLRVN